MAEPLDITEFKEDTKPEITGLDLAEFRPTEPVEDEFLDTQEFIRPTQELTEIEPNPYEGIQGTENVLIDTKAGVVDALAFDNDFDSARMFHGHFTGIGKSDAEIPNTREAVMRDLGSYGVNPKFKDDSWLEVVTKNARQVPHRVQMAAGGLIREIEEAKQFTEESWEGWANRFDEAMRVSQPTLGPLQVARRMALEVYKNYLPKGVGDDIASSAQAKIEHLQPVVEAGSAKDYVGKATQSVILNLSLLAPSLITRSPSLALTGMGLMAKGETYQEQRQRGSTPLTASLASYGYGVSEAATEFIPVGTLLKPSASLLRKMVKLEFQELTTEQINEWVGIAIDKVTIDPEMSLDQALERAWDTLVVTAISTPAIAGVGHVVTGRIKPEGADITTEELNQQVLEIAEESDIDVGPSIEAPIAEEAVVEPIEEARFEEIIATEAPIEQQVEDIITQAERAEISTEVTPEEEIQLIREAIPTAVDIQPVEQEVLQDFATPESRGFQVELPNGNSVTFVTNAVIEPTAENIETIRRTYVEPGLMTEEDLNTGNFVVLGKNQAIGQGGVIALAKEGAVPEVINEEVFELAEKTVLTEEEIAVLSREFGDSIELRSKAYVSWNGQTTTTGGVFEKIRDFFKSILNRFRAPTAEDVFGRVARGDVFEREAIAREEETFAIRPGREVVTDTQPVDQTLRPLENVQEQIIDSTMQDNRDFKATRDQALEAILSARETNPGQPKMLFRGTSVQELAEDGPDKVQLANRRGHATDTGQDIKAVWFTTSLDNAMDIAQDKAGDQGVVIAMPVQAIPEELYIQNVDRFTGEPDVVFVGIPADITKDNIDQKPLTELRESDIFEAEVVRDVTDISERERAELTERRRREGIEIPEREEGRLAERPDIAELEPRRPGERIEAEPEPTARPEGRPRLEETFALKPTRLLGREDVALRQSIQRAVQAAKKAQAEGRIADVEKERTRINRILSEARLRTELREEGKQEILDRVVNELPVSVRGRFVKALLRATTPAQQRKLAERVDRDIQAFNEAKELRRRLGTQRSKIAFIRKIGEFNQAAVTDSKKRLGITNSIKRMTEAELDKMVEQLKARLRFKRSRGFTPSIEERGSKKPDIKETEYDVNRQLASNKKGTLGNNIKKAAEKVGKGVDVFAGAISTRLENIDPSLKARLRKFEFDALQSVKRDMDNVLPFSKKIKKLKPDTYKDLDFAMKNGDTAKINEIIDGNDLRAEYDKVRKVLDDIYERANSVGFDIGYLPNYFPRMINDASGFLEFMAQRDDWSAIDEAIQQKEMALGRTLDLQEKVQMINTLIRGYSGGKITLSGVGNMKSRIIDLITPEMNQFYQDANSSLLRYIDVVNEKIEARKFFGKERPIDKKEDQFNNLDDSIGYFTTQLYSEGKLTVAQEQELKDILTARFNPGAVGPIAGIFRNMSYIDVLGSPINAVTQIGDMAFTAYNAGIIKTAKSLPASLIGKAQISKEDIGLMRSQISAELTNNNRTAQLVDTVFRLTGLTAIDRIGKETLINSSFLKYQELAQRDPEKLKREIKDIFNTGRPEDSPDAVVEDLQAGRITENVKYLVFNELLDFQPIALSEVPQKYLSSGNGKIFYMLKTWTLKMFDVYRREVFQTMKVDKKQGVLNMLKLTTFLVLFNGMADEIKDFMLGRKTTMEDRTIDQLLKIAGFSRYSVSQAQRKGLGSTALEQITPPAQAIDNITRDAISMLIDHEESVKINKLRSIREIPLIGEFYYWWFGKGIETKERERKRNLKP
jgi:hypothetical protein